MTKRILLKLSGEQLQGEFASGFDPKRARWIAEQIRPALDDGAEIVIMVGGIKSSVTEFNLFPHIISGCFLHL